MNKTMDVSTCKKSLFFEVFINLFGIRSSDDKIRHASRLKASNFTSQSEDLKSLKSFKLCSTYHVSIQMTKQKGKTRIMPLF